LYFGFNYIFHDRIIAQLFCFVNANRKGALKITAYSIKRFLIDIVYPNRCPFCDKLIAHDKYYCCIKGTLFENRAENKAENNSTIFVYDDESSPFVYSIKDGGSGYAIAAAASMLCERLPDGVDLITCIPTDSARIRERGYNPPALIAAEMSLQSGILCDTRLLIKTREIALQKSLTAVQRRENVKGAFAVSRGCSGCILLVDDVQTTGATLSEAAEVLISAGAERVCTATVAAVR
jgi:ComF family protein